MKTLLTLFVLFLVGFSFSAFSYRFDEAVWEQANLISCTQTSDTYCIDHNCEQKDYPNHNFIIDFTINELIIPPYAEENVKGRNTKIISKEHINISPIEYDDVIITSEETINISLINNEWHFVKTKGVHYLQKFHLVFSSGFCIEE